MTPAQWVEERANEWAEWVDKNQRGGRGYGGNSLLREYSGQSDAYGHSIDFVILDDRRCSEFEAEVSSLPDHLRIVFKMHWLGSAVKMVSCAASVDVKAGHCGVSRRGYYRRLDEANVLLYNALH